MLAWPAAASDDARYRAVAYAGARVLRKRYANGVRAGERLPTPACPHTHLAKSAHHASAFHPHAH